MRFVLFLTIFFLARGQCPRKKQLENFDENNHPPSFNPPNSVPPDISSITINFIHNDKSENDKNFSQQVKTILEDLKQRLTGQHFILNSKNFNCSKIENVDEKCTNYSLRNSFHLLVVENASRDSEVYSIEKKYNTEKEMVEMSILDVLSRHSNYDMTVFSSNEASKVVGFVRRLDKKELITMSRSHRHGHRHSYFILHSPFELNFVEPSILEYRSFARPEVWNELIQFNPDSLKKTMESDELIFILFWTNVDVISQHVFYLWSKASTILQKLNFNETTIFGGISCHTYSVECSEYSLSINDHRTIFAYKNGERYAHTKGIRDTQYFIEWVKMLLLPSAIELKTENEINFARKGNLRGFDEIRPAITIGIFENENSDDFKTFHNLAEIYRGRYHFAYFIKTGKPSTMYTIRPYEKKKRVDYEGNFDTESMIYFLTRSSFPTIIDISSGFTSDVLLGQARPILIIYHSVKHNIEKIAEFCRKDPSYLCAEIIRENSKHSDDLKNIFQLNNIDSMKIIVLKKKDIFVIDHPEGTKYEAIMANIQKALQEKPTRSMQANDIHPLRFLQLGQINSIFGHQNIELRPEPQLLNAHFHHQMKTSNGDAYGGCPFMSQMNKDEL